jgi:hypothetical protein
LEKRAGLASGRSTLKVNSVGTFKLCTISTASSTLRHTSEQASAMQALTAYELEREEQIAENRRRMGTMGIMHTARLLKCANWPKDELAAALGIVETVRDMARQAQGTVPRPLPRKRKVATKVTLETHYIATRKASCSPRTPFACRYPALDLSLHVGRLFAIGA